MTNISKNQTTSLIVESFVAEEVKEAMIQEGFVDNLKAAWKKTKGAAGNAWEQIKGKFASSINGAKEALQTKVTELKSAYPQIKNEFDQLRQIEAQSGEKLGTNQAISDAMKLPSLVNAAKSEIQQASQSVKQIAASDVQPAATPNLQNAQEAYMGGVDSILGQTLFEAKVMERRKTRHLSENKIPKKVRSNITLIESQRLDEAGIVGLAGLALGTLGGIPLLLKGLHKLANYLGLEKTSSALEHAYHAMHHVEESVIDYLVPDNLSYLYYKSKHKVFAKSNEPEMTLEEYKTSEVRGKVEMRIYKVVLVYFLFHGVHGALEAGFSMLGAAEGAASTVKAIEIGTGIAELAGGIAANRAVATMV